VDDAAHDRGTLCASLRGVALWAPPRCAGWRNAVQKIAALHSASSPPHRVAAGAVARRGRGSASNASCRPGAREPSPVFSWVALELFT